MGSGWQSQQTLRRTTAIGSRTLLQYYQQGPGLYLGRSMYDSVGCVQSGT
jgi:hypothetical protein